MARWNNGFLVVKDNHAVSTKSTPQDAANEASISDYSLYADLQRQSRDVRNSRGRFTANPTVGYVFSDLRSVEHQRGSGALPFVDYPGSALATGGDLRDINALGGGLPGSPAFIGGGTPGRQSPFSRPISLRFDRRSEVPRT